HTKTTTAAKRAFTSQRVLGIAILLTGLTGVSPYERSYLQCSALWPPQRSSPGWPVCQFTRQQRPPQARASRPARNRPVNSGGGYGRSRRRTRGREAWPTLGLLLPQEVRAFLTFTQQTRELLQA